MKDTFQEFSWALRRMASMQGCVIDVLRLRECEAMIAGVASPVQMVKTVCKEMDLPAPAFPNMPDRAHLPMLYCSPERRWGVVFDCTPTGQWLVGQLDGVCKLDPRKLHGALVVLKFASSVGLGLPFFKAADATPTFFNHIRATLELYKTELVEACLASAFIGFLALATSLFSMQVYDRVIPIRSEHTLIILSLGVLLTILIELAIKFTRSHIMDHIVVGMDSRLSREVFQRLLQLRIDQVPTSVGSLAAQLRGYEQLRNFYTATTLFTLIDLPLAVCFLLVITWIATPWVAFVAAVSALSVLYLGWNMRRKTMQHARQSAALSNMKTGLLVEAVEGIETIKAGSGGWKFLSRWIDVNSTTIKSDLEMRRSSEGVNYWVAAVQQIGYAALVAVGAVVVMRGEMTMGALIACSILSGRILAPIMALPNLLVQHAHAIAALEGLERLYKLKTDNDGIEQHIVPDKINGHYKLEAVRFAYADNPPSIVIPSLSIQPGERVAVVGPIGAGKSTLLRLLSGLYPPQDGRVLLDDLDITHIHRQVLNQHIGYLQQDHRLFQGTLRDNLLIGLPDPGDEVILQAMRRTGMDKFVAAHPKGLARQITEGGKGLSGGQKQLLAFTRLALCRPQIMLLDEPTAAMDDEQEKKCLNVLREEVQSGKTLIVVTHKPNIFALVNRIIVIAGNQIVTDGPRNEVLNQLKQRIVSAPVSGTKQKIKTSSYVAAST